MTWKPYELIGGPLDGQTVPLEGDLTGMPHVEGIRMNWGLAGDTDAKRPQAIYRARFWRDQGLRLVFTGYAEEGTE